MKRLTFKTYLISSLLIILLAGCAKSTFEDNLPPFLRGSFWHQVSDNFQIPDQSQRPEVQKEIRFFLHNKSHLNKVLNNSAPYIQYLYQQTQERKLPAELALLPFIESEYQPFAYSKVGAMGLWQMMPGTASGFGIKINWWYDGRRDIISSTHAALNYLHYLNNYFNNNWLLAIASYNTGEGTVDHAIKFNVKHHAPTDFWDLRLPRETETYVPKLLAICEIIKNPGKYGITLPRVSDNQYLAQIDVGSQIDLNQAAKLAEVSPELIRKLNPGYLRWATDPNGPFTLLIPQSQVKIFENNLNDLPEYHRVTWLRHHVKSGDNLITIARRYNTNTSVVKKVNNLKSSNIGVGETLLIPKSVQHLWQTHFSSQNKLISESNIPGPKQKTYTVKPGDTVEKIAKHYHDVSVRDILFWNNLSTRDKYLTPGTELTIWTHNDIHSFNPENYYHKVKPGDNLDTLAKRYGSTVKAIKRKNKLKSNNIPIGKVLIIPGKYINSRLGEQNRFAHSKSTKRSHYTHYRVQPGDTLAKIAHKHHVSTQNLIHWNQLSKNAILGIDQKLIIYG